MNKKHKYIFVIGGVMSGVGKGIASSSIGTLLEAKGYRVNLMKVDPYLNVDAGTMNPTEHGEVFVLNSGLETDQDMGNYERFLNIDLGPENYMTSGMIYKYVIEKERALGYKGKCVEAIPDIRDEILRRFVYSAEKSDSDITVIEIGGTIGDYQNALFIEAARVLKVKKSNDVLFITVSYLPIPGKIGEMKTRPTQNAVRQLNSYGVHTDIIIARAELPLDKKRKEKIAIACSISPEDVISAPDIDSVYDVPINFEKDKLGSIILKKLKLKQKRTEGLKKWQEFAIKIKNLKEEKKEVKIGIVGKYFNTGDFVLTDSYLSVLEALKYSAVYNNCKIKIETINAKDFEDDKSKINILKSYNGILVPGGFGESGIEGKLMAIKYARENKIPYFGLCYGMQLLVIEYARSVCKMKDATTGEIDSNSKSKVIDIQESQKENIKNNSFGGSMRLGLYESQVKEGTVASKAYGKSTIKERHRHRYEVSLAYVKQLEEKGLIFSSSSQNNTLMEIAELPQKEHPFFLGTQFHPEFLARPLSPHPLFNEFIKVSKSYKIN